MNTVHFCDAFPASFFQPILTKSKFKKHTGDDLPYLPVVVVVRRLDVLLNQVGLHGNEKVTCCTVGRFHLPHEMLHAKIYRTDGKYLQ